MTGDGTEHISAEEDTSATPSPRSQQKTSLQQRYIWGHILESSVSMSTFIQEYITYKTIVIINP